MQHLVSEPERRRFLGRLVREVSRAEQMASEHAAREARRIGDSAPPVAALRALAAHAEAMRPRFTAMVSGYDLPTVRGGLGAALATLRDIVVDRIVQSERAYRIALLDIRQGLDVVKLLRETARGDELLGLMRWCDDWLSARRTLLAHAERELAWFSAIPAHTGAVAQAEIAPSNAEIRGGAPTTSDDRPTSRDGR
jgi:hypothetical protein